MGKINIRQGVFETNSSSSHSLTIAKSASIKAPFNKKVVKEGKLYVATGDYNWEWYRYHKAENKIAYLLTGILCSRGEPQCLDTRVLREDYPDFDLLYSVVKDYTGVELVVTGASGYIDHQSDDRYQEALKDAKTLKRFLFNESSSVTTGNDNSEPPLKIQGDQGCEDYYKAYRVEVPPSYTEIGISTENHELRVVQADGTAVALSTAMLKKIAKQGIATKIVWHTSKERGSREDPEATALARATNICKLATEVAFSIVTEASLKNWWDGYGILTVAVPPHVQKGLVTQ